MQKIGYQTGGILLALTGALLFSTKAVFVKLAYAYEVDSVSLLLIRMMLALPFYLFMIFRYRKNVVKTWHEVPRKYWVGLFVAASLGYYLSSYLDFVGLQYIDASVERLILFIYPTFIAIMSVVFFRHRITGNQLLALALSYIGLLFVFGQNLQSVSFTSDFWIGSTYILICALTFALFLVMSQWLIPRFGVREFTSLSMAIACLMVVAHYLLSDTVNVLANLPLPVYLYGLAMASIATVIPSYIVNHAIARIGATKAAIMASVGPISTISLAYWLLNERLQLVQLAGAILIIIGVTVVSVEMKRKKLKPSGS